MDGKNFLGRGVVGDYHFSPRLRPIFDDVFLGNLGLPSLIGGFLPLSSKDGHEAAYERVYQKQESDTDKSDLHHSPHTCRTRSSIKLPDICGDIQDF